MKAMFKNFRQTVAERIYPEFAAERRALERAANFDALTGVANRRAYDLAEPAALKDQNAAFILFDANNFGLLNKAEGQTAGDKVLQRIARAIVEAAADNGCSRVFRLGGDEFVVITTRGRAKDIRDAAEFYFGKHYFNGGFVSLTGMAGESLDDANKTLQFRKRIQKGEI